MGSDKFVVQTDWVDSELKRQTVGLVNLEDFQRIRSTLEEQNRLKKDSGTKEKAVDKSKLKNKKRDQAVLSFGDEEEEDESKILTITKDDEINNGFII